jgi:hypothetical protein
MCPLFGQGRGPTPGASGSGFGSLKVRWKYKVVFKVNDPISYPCPQALCYHEPLQIPDVGVFMTESAGDFITRLEASGSRDNMSVVDKCSCRN